MIAHVTVLLLSLALSACVLPDGKLDRSSSTQSNATNSLAKGAAVDAARPADAGSTSDAAARGEDSGIIGPSAGGAGGVGVAGKGGAGGAPASMMKAKPKTKPKGEVCRGNEDCDNGNCKTGDNGERRCYGGLKVDQTCVGAYDCDGFSCVPLTPKGKASVCVDKAACAMQGACFEDYGVAMCQLDQQCGAAATSFNACYQKACVLAGSSNAQCLAALPAKQSLNESACCPTGGVLNGACSTGMQCGCGDGMKCALDGMTGKTACQAIGSVAPGGLCTKPEDCTKGYGCMGGVCKQYCAGDRDTSCASEGTCNPVTFMTAPTGVYYCTRTCDPFSPGSTDAPFLGCVEGERCNPTPDGHSDCSLSGNVPVGGSCDDGMGRPLFNACAPSSICMTSPKLVCAAFCHIGGDDCKTGTCRSFGNPPYYVGQTEVGFCDPP